MMDRQEFEKLYLNRIADPTFVGLRYQSMFDDKLSSYTHLMSPTLRRLRLLRGDQFNLAYRVFQLWKEDDERSGLIKEFAKEFPEYVPIISSAVDKLNSFIKLLLKNYVFCWLDRKRSRDARIDEYLRTLHTSVLYSLASPPLARRP